MRFSGHSKRCTYLNISATKAASAACGITEIAAGKCRHLAAVITSHDDPRRVGGARGMGLSLSRL